MGKIQIGTCYVRSLALKFLDLPPTQLVLRLEAQRQIINDMQLLF